MFPSFSVQIRREGTLGLFVRTMRSKSAPLFHLRSISGLSFKVLGPCYRHRVPGSDLIFALHPPETPVPHGVVPPETSVCLNPDSELSGARLTHWNPSNLVENVGVTGVDFVPLSRP